MTIRIIKGVVVYLLLIVNSTFCFGQFTEQSPREGRLKGKVESVVFANYYIMKDGNVEVKEFNDRVAYYYDLKGLLKEERSSDEENVDSKQYRSVYNYNAEGHLSSVIEYDQENAIADTETYTFDPTKRLVHLTLAKTSTTKMQLDDVGNVIEMFVYHHNPEPFSTTRYKYNAKGLCSESVQSWSKSKDLHKTIYEYDANDNLIKETAYKNASVIATYTYTYSKYDQFKNWLVQKTYKSGRLDGVSERNIYYQR